MNEDELDDVENKLCEVYALLKSWHPGWGIFLPLLSRENRQVSVLVWVNGLKYKYVMDVESIRAQHQTTLAWFIERALTR